MKSLLHPRLRWGSGRLAPWLVLATGIVLSVAAWFLTQTLVERDARHRFQATTIGIAAAAQARIRSYADMLYGLQGLFQAEPAVSRAAFDRYVYSLNLALHYPGVRSVSYVRRVPASAKAEFERQLNRDPELIRRGYGNVVIKPAGERSEYFVLTYIEPLHANKAALGFDVASNAQRMAPVERARDSGMPTLSGRLALATDPTQSEFGIILRLALYRKDAFTPDVERRREAFSGLVNVAFQMQELAQRILSEEGYEKFTLSIHDAGYIDSGPPPAPQELYSNAAFRPPQAGAVFKDARYIDVGQRRWELKFSAPQEHFMRAADHVLPWAALFAVLVASALLSGLIRSLAGSRQRAKTLAAQITADLRASQAKLTEEQRRTQELIEVLPNPVFFKGTDGRYLGVNRAWEKFFGVPRNAFIGKTVHELYPDKPDIAERLHADDQALWDHPGTKSYETSITTPDGRHRDAVYYKATFTDTDGRVAGLICTIVDITERKQTELRQRMEHTVTRILAEAGTLAEAVPRIIQTICETMGWHCGARWQMDKEAGVLRCVECWGVDTPEIREFMAGNSQAAVNPAATSGRGLLRRIYNSGEPLWITDIAQEQGLLRAPLVIKAGLHGAFGFPLLLGGEVLGLMEFFHRDVREPDALLLRIAESIGNQIGQFMARKQAEERIRQLASYDELTGLPNRSMFHERLHHALAQARRYAKPLAVLFIDLDRFKNINDTLGHEAGDCVLREFAERLRACLRDSDTVGRLGGDEFVVLIHEYSRPVDVVTVAQKILEAVARPFILAAQAYHIGASIGISAYPGDGTDLQTLLKHADAAMYRAKEQGRNNFQFYSAQMIAAGGA